MRTSLYVVSLAASVSLLAGCADDASCDPGQELQGGACVPASGSGGSAGNAGMAGTADAGAGGGGGSRAAAGATSGGAGGDAAGAAGAAGAGGGASAACAFGSPCTDDVNHSECTCDADYCAIQPGQAEGICTTTGCVEDATVCPDGWGCLDLSAFQAGLPSICTQP